MSVPSTKDVHVVLVDYCRVTESNLRLHEKTKLIRKLARVDKRYMLFCIWINLSALDVAPAIGSNLVAVHVREDVSLISATI